MSRQVSQMSVESMEDCWSENEIRPLTTCWSFRRRPTNSCTTVADQCHDDASDISLKSCNSIDALKQWTMQYPVTACCQSLKDCRRAFSGRRRRRRRRRRQRSCNDDDASDDDETLGDTDVAVMYTDRNGEVRCCKQRVCNSKPCTLVRLHV